MYKSTLQKWNRTRMA